MSGHLLEVRDLSVVFESARATVRAVDGVSYHVDRGEVLAILGESGSGKSVQASAVMGILDTPPARITSGSVTFDGIDLLGASDATRRDINGRRIAMIFQDTLAHLNPVYKVGWQVAEALECHGHSGAQARKRAVELFERVGIPNPVRRMDDYPHQFSGGQRQRVMIAMALAMKPDLLIADEPTTALDVTVQAQILSLLKELRDETGMGLVMITHDLGIVAENADRVIVMNGGRIVEQGGMGEVLARPQHPYTRKLMEAVPGRHPLEAKEAGRRDAVLRVEGLVKHYEVTRGLMRRATGEAVKAVDGIDLELCAGETLGIVGESGSGKSTLARTLLLLEQPTGGRVTFRGKDIFALEGADLMAYRRKVQVVFQDPFASLNPRMSVHAIIAEPWAIHSDVLERRRHVERVEELLVAVGLSPEHRLRHPHQFSGGQRQRIAIARALALEPEVIILDEAVSALDVSIQAQVIELLKSLRDRMGLSYLFIAHDLPVVRDIADRVMVMKGGKVVEEGSVEQIFERPRHAYTQNLLAASPVPVELAAMG
ncbi:MAG: ABC transporter ATP-binding protein [Geminicoccaceae bacterium]